MLHIQHTEYSNIIEYNDMWYFEHFEPVAIPFNFRIKECCFKVIHMPQSINRIIDTKTDLPNIFLPCRGDVEGE